MQQHQQPLPTLSSGARRTPQTPRPQNRSRSPRTPEALRQGQQPQAQRDAQDQASASEQSGIGIRERLEQFRKARKAKGCQNSDAIDNVKGKIQNKEEGNQRHGRQREGQDSCARPIPHRSPWSTTPSLRRLMKLAESGKPPPPSLRPSRQLWPMGDDGNRIPLQPGLVVTVGGARQEPPGLPPPELPRPPDHTDRGVSKRRWETLMMQWRDALRAFLW